MHAAMFCGEDTGAELAVPREIWRTTAIRSSWTADWLVWRVADCGSWALCFRAGADCQSAIQQIANLRYEAVRERRIYLRGCIMLRAELEVWNIALWNCGRCVFECLPTLPVGDTADCQSALRRRSESGELICVVGHVFAQSWKPGISRFKICGRCVFGRFADCQSAIQQIANLGYGVGAPGVR